MIKVTIVEPKISKEENDRQLIILKKTIEDIVRSVRMRKEA